MESYDMKNVTLFCCFMFMAVFLFMCSCRKTSHPAPVNYIGKSKTEVASMLSKTERFRFNKGPQIMLSVHSGFFYYDRADDIIKDDFVMRSDEWEVNFREHGWYRYFYKIIFSNGYVTKQSFEWMSDGP